MQGPFFLSHTSQLNQQKQCDVISKSVAIIYHSNKYDSLHVCLLLTNHETLDNLYIVLSLLSQSLPFVLQLQVCNHHEPMPQLS